MLARARWKRPHPRPSARPPLPRNCCCKRALELGHLQHYFPRIQTGIVHWPTFCGWVEAKVAIAYSLTHCVWGCGNAGFALADSRISRAAYTRPRMKCDVFYTFQPGTFVPHRDAGRLVSASHSQKGACFLSLKIPPASIVPLPCLKSALLVGNASDRTEPTEDAGQPGTVVLSFGARMRFICLQGLLLILLTICFAFPGHSCVFEHISPKKYTNDKSLRSNPVLE